MSISSCRGARLTPISAEQTIPPGQVEAEVAVGLVVRHRVMHPMHVWGDNDPAKTSIHPEGNSNVAVVEKRRRVQ